MNSPILSTSGGSGKITSWSSLIAGGRFGQEKTTTDNYCQMQNLISAIKSVKPKDVVDFYEKRVIRGKNANIGIIRHEHLISAVNNAALIDGDPLIVDADTILNAWCHKWKSHYYGASKNDFSTVDASYLAFGAKCRWIVVEEIK